MKQPAVPQALLAIDTSTETLSVAVSRATPEGLRMWQRSAPGAAQASLHLIRITQELMQEAALDWRALDAICFGSGPGSFTGLRTACSVAQGLGFAASVPLLPVNSLLAMAEEARYALDQRDADDWPIGTQVLSLLDARMDEVYAGAYQWTAQGWQSLGPSVLSQPQALDAALLNGPAQVLAGNVFAVYGERLPPRWHALPQLPVLPTASAMLRVAPQLLREGLAVPAEQALPAYIRDKVAQTTAERTALRAAKLQGDGAVVSKSERAP